MKNLFVAISAMLMWCGLGAQDFSVSTNVLDYVNMGTLNVDASYGFSRHWSVVAGVKYNPFTWGEGDSTRQNRQRSLSAGARYWPWYVYSGWWIEGSLRWKEYNVGGFKSSETTEGNKFGPGVKAGYSYMLNSHFNIEAGAGVWAAYDKYVVYACPTCGKVVDGGAKVFILPADIVLSVSFIF